MQQLRLSFLILIILFGCETKKDKNQTVPSSTYIPIDNGNENALISDAGSGEFRLHKPAKTKRQNHENFITIAKAANRMGEKHPAVLAAQWAIESGWGRKESGKNNYFGIKVPPSQKGKGLGTVRYTREQKKSGQEYYINDEFMNYPNLLEGIRGRIQFIKNNPRYRRHGYFEASNPVEAAKALQRAGYATDINYASILGKVIAGVRYNGKNLNPYQPLRFQIGAISIQQSPTAGSGAEAREVN